MADGACPDDDLLTGAVDPDPWPDPQPLTAKLDPQPYPVDALPPCIRAAVTEVAGFVQAPLPLVAGSALAALSVATQAHVDVRRAEKLEGPTSIFLLSIADSGERKSTCDGFFSSPIRQYDADQAEAAKQTIVQYEANLAAWTAERDGLLSAIRADTAKGKATGAHRAALDTLQKRKPARPRAQRMLLGDETPENLAWTLAQDWPAAGVLSAEAGLVFGSHGMGKDSVMRNLALLNTLWDGGTLSIGRRTSESFRVAGARLTMGLQIQEATLRDFFTKSGTLARGTGFLARFLVSWPASTQGSRPFREPPARWPHLAQFHSRLTELLGNPVTMDEAGGLDPAMMDLAPDAKAAWIAFHDAIEAKLADGGELRDVRDVASKTADNAARLAALFQTFEAGPTGPVNLAAFAGASRIAAWHLIESLRFFGELALPTDLADASRLDAWLIGHCRRESVQEVGKSVALQFGPLRQKDRLDAALRELVELSRVRLGKAGKRTVLEINPSLFANANPANPANAGGC